MYNQKEIVLVPFPFSDLTSTKKRPVLIVSNNNYNSRFDDVVVCVITSIQKKDEYSILIEDSFLEIGTLPETSIIKTHKLFTIHKSKIIKKYCSINSESFELVFNNLTKLFSSTKSKN